MPQAEQTMREASCLGDRAGLDDSLRRYLDRRLRAAEGVDGEFARDLAGALVRFTLDGGKRMRSLLAWWGWIAGRGATEGACADSALQGCAALELFQTFTLVQDDVMDDSALRRGRPSVHAAYVGEHARERLHGEGRRYGEALAVLLGDLALAWADDMVDEALADLPTRACARGVWRRMRTEVIAGQFLDVRAQARQERSEDMAMRVNLFKTAGYSVECPLHLGAAMAGAEDATVAALRGYGTDVGTAFQLRDDLLGVYGEPESTGKPVGEDIREGKCTLLLAAGLRLAREHGDTGTEDLLRTCGSTSDDAAVAETARALDRTGARALVEHRRRDLVASGIARLDAVRLDPRVREQLVRFGGLAACDGP